MNFSLRNPGQSIPASLVVDGVVHGQSDDKDEEKNSLNAKLLLQKPSLLPIQSMKLAIRVPGYGAVESSIERE